MPDLKYLLLFFILKVPSAFPFLTSTTTFTTSTVAGNITVIHLLRSLHIAFYKYLQSSFNLIRNNVYSKRFGEMSYERRSEPVGRLSNVTVKYAHGTERMCIFGIFSEFGTGSLWGE